MHKEMCSMTAEIQPIVSDKRILSSAKNYYFLHFRHNFLHIRPIEHPKEGKTIRKQFKNMPENESLWNWTLMQNIIIRSVVEEIEVRKRSIVLTIRIFSASGSIRNRKKRNKNFPQVEIC